MSKYTRGLLAVILAVVLVLPAAAFAMLPEANARSSTGMDGPTVSEKIVDPDTTGRWQYWASGGEQDQTTRYVGRIWTDKTVEPAQDEKSDFVTTLSTMSSTSDTTSLVTKPLDIVMVLDASGSMDDDMGDSDSTKRIDDSRQLPVPLSTPSPSKTRALKIRISGIRLPSLSFRVQRKTRSATIRIAIVRDPRTTTRRP